MIECTDSNPMGTASTPRHSADLYFRTTTVPPGERPGFEDYVNAFAVHGNTIYVASLSDVGMFRSGDRGETWKPINNGFRLFEDSDGPCLLRLH